MSVDVLLRGAALGVLVWFLAYCACHLDWTVATFFGIGGGGPG